MVFAYNFHITRGTPDSAMRPKSFVTVNTGMLAIEGGTI
jgi:hypothetical protein